MNSRHKWKAVIGSRSRYQSGCKKCVHQSRKERIKGDRSLQTNFPDVAKEWNDEKNDIPSNEITYGSAKVYWWRCTSNPEHEWQASVASRTGNRKSKCPYCAGVVVTESNSLAALYPEIAKEWNYDKNASLSPESVTKASGRKVWWKCRNDESHEWEAVIRNRTTLGSGCPICNAETQYLRLAHYQFGTSSKGTDYHIVFQSNLSNVIKFIDTGKFKGSRLDQPFMRMLYSSVITVMETYLSDAFYEMVVNSDEMVNQLFLKDPELSAKKYNVTELLRWSDNKCDIAAEHMQKIVWHNLPRVANLYRSVLGVNISLDNQKIHNAISMRHDLVHRNGKTKSGGTVRITERLIKDLVEEVKGFVQDIDNQIEGLQENLTKSSSKDAASGAA